MIVMNAATFAHGPGLLFTFLPAGPQLEEVVLFQTEQAVSIDVDHLKNVRQHLPVARLENYSKIGLYLNMFLLKKKHNNNNFW